MASAVLKRRPFPGIRLPHNPYITRAVLGSSAVPRESYSREKERARTCLFTTSPRTEHPLNSFHPTWVRPRMPRHTREARGRLGET